MRPFALAALLLALALPAAHAAPQADLWAYERTRINEFGYYPVPEFLRDADAPRPKGRPRVPGEQSPTGVAYAEARRTLIHRGFLPVTVVATDGYRVCDGGRSFCRTFPEVLNCSVAGMQYCAFLYRHAATRSYWIVSTVGEGEPPDFNGFRCCGYRPATQYYLDGVTILRANGRRFRFAYPRDPDVEPPTPLCRDNGGKMPCWIKPPPGYKPPR